MSDADKKSAAPASAKATPAATPKATPRATPAATPKPTPKATPAATPKATAKATAKATPAATPKPTPGATPAKATTAKPTPMKEPAKEPEEEMPLTYPAEPQIDPKEMFQMYPNSAFSRSRLFDQRTVATSREVAYGLLTDLLTMKNPNQSPKPDVDAFRQQTKDEGDVYNLALKFFALMNKNSMLKLDYVTVCGALHMAMQNTEDSVFECTPVEFWAQSLFVMAFRNRHQDPGTYAAFERHLPCFVDANIRGQLMAISNVAKAKPGALEAKFYHETPFYCDLERIQDMAGNPRASLSVSAREKKANILSAMGDCQVYHDC